MRSVREMLGLAAGYNPTGFARVFDTWDMERKEAYEQRISFLLAGGPVTKEAHEEAVKAAGFRRGKRHFEALREAVEHPGEFSL